MRINSGSNEITVTRWVDVVCTKCHGDGQRLYGSTATWRGGIGGQAMTTDVCDHCWGSGDEAHPGYDIRKHEAGVRQLVEERAARLLENSMGAGIGCLTDSQRFIAKELQRISRKRKAPSDVAPLAICLEHCLLGLADAGRDWKR